MSGQVVAFDREVGLGEIALADGTRVPFHCIEIADGTRDIAIGARVSFSFIGKLGRYEAARISPV
jgi:cold shock CspA family protein